MSFVFRVQFSKFTSSLVQVNIEKWDKLKVKVVIDDFFLEFREHLKIVYLSQVGFFLTCNSIRDKFN